MSVCLVVCVPVSLIPTDSAPPFSRLMTNRSKRIDSPFVRLMLTRLKNLANKSVILEGKVCCYSHTSLVMTSSVRALAYSKKISKKHYKLMSNIIKTLTLFFWVLRQMFKKVQLG